jgi:hypothetical protein
MKSKLLLFVLLSSALNAAGCGKDGAAPPPAIVGEWRSSVQFKTGAFASIDDLEFMFVFNLGGTMTESSNYDGSPPTPPAYGIWRSLGPQEFEAKYEFYVTHAPSDVPIGSGGWLPGGRGVFVERITLSHDGASFTSNVVYEAFDAEGNPSSGGGHGEGRGVRVVF